MTSEFYKISNRAFLEVGQLYDHPLKEYGLRIVHITSDGEEGFCHVGAANKREVRDIVRKFKLKRVPTFTHFDDVRRYWYMKI